MKYKSLFALAAASLTMLFACEKPVDLGPEEVTIVSSDVPEEIPVDGGEYTVELKATLDWTVQNYEGEVTSWLSIKPSSGEASAENQTISIKVGQNTGANRSFDIVFYGNIMHEATLTISQPGPEGDGESLTVAEFIEKADTQNEYVLTGVIGDIATSSKYWGFTLKDDTGTISCPFIGANADEFKAMDMHTGDSVSVKGVYEFYTQKSEHQLSDGTIVEYKALPSESIETVTVEQFITAADPFTMYRLTGEVSSSVNSQYCSFDLTDDSGTIVVWTVNNASEYGSTLKQGDKVTLRGAYTWYENTENPSSSKHEVVDATIEAVEPGQGGGEIGTPAGSGTAEDPYNVAAAYKFIDDGGYNSPTLSPEVYVKGTISSIEEVDTGDFGNATYCITDGEGSAELTVFRGYYLNGDKFTSADQIKIGDEVVVVGQLTNYNGTYEFNSKNRIYSINGKGGGETPDPEPEDPDPVPGDWIYSNSFNNGQGDFTIVDKTLPEALNYVWKHDGDFDCMKASAYVDNTNYATESWLISPVIDLTAETEAYLAFEHATNYFNTTTLADDASVWAREEGSEEWTKLTGVNYPASQGWTFVKSGDVDMSAFAGTKMQFAFVYKSSDSKAGTWEVKNVVVKDSADGDVPPTPTPEGSIVLSFPDDNSENNHANNYTSTWTAMSGDYSFEMVSFNNFNWDGWTYVRCGHGKTPYVSTIGTMNAMPQLSSVEVAIGSRFEDDALNDLYLAVYSDAQMTQQVGANIEPSGNRTTNSVLTFVVPEDIQDANLYYKIVFDCAVGSRNGFIEVSKVTYIASE